MRSGAVWVRAVGLALWPSVALVATAPLGLAGAREHSVGEEAQGAPPAALVALLDSNPGIGDGWSATLARAAGSPAGLLRALAAVQPGARAELTYGERWGREQRHALLTTLARSSPSELSAALMTFDRGSRAKALAVIDAIGALGSDDDAATVALALQELRRLSQAESRTIGDALARFLHSAPNHPDTLARAFATFPDDAQAAVLTGIASMPSDTSFRFARQALDATATPTPHLIAVLTVTAPTTSRLERAYAAATVRQSLASEDSGLVLAAVQATRALADVEASAELVRLFGHRSREVRRAALEALVALTGRASTTDSAVWQQWLQQESSWARASYHLGAVLVRGSEERALGAVREVVARVLHRKERERLLELGLTHRSPLVRAAAARGLAQIPTEDALATLVRIAERDPVDVVREAARSSVQGLTHLGAEPLDPAQD